MKIALTIISVWVICTVQLFAQQKTLRQGCDFLKNLHFKNGVDTLMIIAYKNATISTPKQDIILDKLHGAKRLNKYSMYSIDLQPIGCSERIFVYCSDSSRFARNIYRDIYEKPVMMRCIVFEGFMKGAHPFFIVDKITPHE
ncbi:MAG: hypothetical protein ACXVJD_02875 [Mucilaginibacter sp.]